MFFPVTLLVWGLTAMPPPLCRGKSGSQYDPQADQAPSPRALAEVQLAYDVLCPDNTCGAGQILRNDSVGMNALTWVSGIRDGPDTRARIVYSANFLDALSRSFGPGASYGVLAHEVGHHLTAARSLRSHFESSWNEELRADYLAGCALGRAGRSTEEMENALRALASAASPTHPSFEHRNPVVRKGFHECSKASEKGWKPPRPFGLGALLAEKKPQGEGCWRYRYRLVEDVDRVGPIAAPSRWSSLFASEGACDVHREKLEKAHARAPEVCICGRGRKTARSTTDAVPADSPG